MVTTIERPVETTRSTEPGLQPDEEFRRCTPDEVIEAYYATDLVPYPGIFVEGRYACALGAVYAKQVVDPDEAVTQDAIEFELGLNSYYVDGFARGFDCTLDGNRGYAESVLAEALNDTGRFVWAAFEKAVTGFRDGMAAAERVSEHRDLFDE